MKKQEEAGLLEFKSLMRKMFFTTGRGKTHLAIAIGVACANAGRKVRFFGTADLVMQLKKHKKMGLSLVL